MFKHDEFQEGFNTGVIMMIGLIMLVASAAFFTGCGKEDKDRQMCAVYGENCDPEEEKQKEEPQVIVGPQGSKGDKGKDGDSCSITEAVNGAVIVCGESQVVILNGIDGTNGVNGVDGQNGIDGVDGQNGADGQDGLDGVDGQDGQDGADGQDGENGEDGEDGAPGPQGPPGPQGDPAPSSPMNIHSFVDPCGNGPGFDEIVIKTVGGQFIALGKQGNNFFLQLLSNGNYTTRDQQSCNYTISGSNITW